MNANNASKFKPQIAAQGAIRALVRRANSGLWIVQDEMNRRGGRFIDRRAALHYIRREFGSNAQIVMPQGSRVAH